jgi:hypothetical protein
VTGAVTDKDVRIQSFLEYGDEIGRIAKVTSIVSGPMATVQTTFSGRMSEGRPTNHFELTEMRYAHCYLVIVCIFGQQIDIERSNAKRQE